jgi:hypothetical protein
LLFKLWPIASRDDGYFGDTEKVAEERRHLCIQRRLTFGKRAVEIKNNQPLHSLSIRKPFDTKEKIRLANQLASVFLQNFPESQPLTDSPHC